jgi:hypothetical protein
MNNEERMIELQTKINHNLESQNKLLILMYEEAKKISSALNDMKKVKPK